jgi:hypothetical protein
MEEHILQCLPTKGLTYISVGSGSGKRERILSVSGSISRHFICIDPSPSSWPDPTGCESSKRLQTLGPHYETVQSYLAAIAETKTTKPLLTVLCLFHPYPSDPKYPSAGYDWEAIQLLKPDFILIMAQKEESGSEALWKWIEQEHEKENYEWTVFLRTLLHPPCRCCRFQIPMGYYLFTKKDRTHLLNLKQCHNLTAMVDRLP